MQELEKILEEIEKGTHTFELLGRDVDFVAIDWVRDVIRKYMNDDNEIMEQCPYCETENKMDYLRYLEECEIVGSREVIRCERCGNMLEVAEMEEEEL